MLQAVNYLIGSKEGFFESEFMRNRAIDLVGGENVSCVPALPREGMCGGRMQAG
jgi:hypothetical protein